MKRKVLPCPCHCGGKLVEVLIEVAYFGHDFGLRPGHACTRCGDEFLSDEAWQEVEDKAKELGLFGLERKVRVRKSGNSLVITIPPEIASYLGVHKDALVSLLPSGAGSLEVEVVG